MLTKMKRSFISEYCADPKVGQAEAARRAGASIKRAKSTAYEWMRDPEIKREIDRQLALKNEGRIEVLAKTGDKLKPEDVIAELDAIEETCKLAGPGAWQVATRVKVAELKGKWLKMWTEKIEFGFDEKLIARLEAGRKNAGLKAPELPAAGEIVQ
jgi:phage terminase small subunit